MKIPFVKPSTQAFIGEARQLLNYSLLDFLHGYICGCWIYQYIDIGTGQPPSSRNTPTG